MRTTRTELDSLAAILSRYTGIPLAIGYAYGRPRLESADGSRDHSPRLSAGDLAQYIRAMIAGADMIATASTYNAEGICPRCGVAETDRDRLLAE